MSLLDDETVLGMLAKPVAALFRSGFRERFKHLMEPSRIRVAGSHYPSNTRRAGAGWPDHPLY
jgi:hypothetical protein